MLLFLVFTLACRSTPVTVAGSTDHPKGETSSPILASCWSWRRTDNPRQYPSCRGDSPVVTDCQFPLPGRQSFDIDSRLNPPPALAAEVPGVTQDPLNPGIHHPSPSTAVICASIGRIRHSPVRCHGDDYTRIPTWLPFWTRCLLRRPGIAGPQGSGWDKGPGS